MTDILTRRQRSALMAKVKGSGNASTELRLVAVFRALGITGWRRVQSALAASADPASLLSMSERIVIDPDICNGRPVVRGTRIAAQTVLEFLAAGDSIEDLLAEYPALTREDARACLDYASRLMANHYSVVASA
jgi:uncharacterized protein (DUF433 family)